MQDFNQAISMSLQPIESQQRITIIDILRGWALLGVVILNYSGFAKQIDPKIARLDQLTTVGSYILGSFFSAKSWTLLSVLFGYGFAVLITNLQTKQLNPVRFFAGRMGWLFVLALVNSAFYYGDILKDYALLGFVLLLFYRFSGKTMLISGIVLLMIIPFVQPLVNNIPYHYEATKELAKTLAQSNNLWEVFQANLLSTCVDLVLSPPYAITVHLVMLACIFLGYAAYQYGLFNHLVQKKQLIKRVFWYSLPVALVLAVLSISTRELKWTYVDFYNPRYITVVSMMVWLASSICWLYVSGKCGWLLRGMQWIGRMTLTNYMAQNVISFLIFSGVGFGLADTLPRWYCIVLALVVYILQVFFSQWWLARYHYGPVEWIWRTLSYRSKLTNRRAKNNVAV